MARRHHALHSAPSTGAARRFSAVVAPLLGLALLFSTPAIGASQTPAEVPDDVFRAQLEARLAESSDPYFAELLSQDCERILAGPNRARALANGDCVEDPLGGGLETITPEPSTMALIAVPAVLMMLGVGRRRRQESQLSR